MSDYNIKNDLEFESEKELIVEFVKSLEEKLSLYENALEKKDFESLGGIGHKLAGSGGTYGFDKISDIGTQIEYSAEDKDFEKLIELKEKLFTEVNGLIEAYLKK